MNWSDEIRMSRFKDSEAGMLAKIRLTFKIRFEGLETDADDVFGVGWPGRAETLRRAGVLRVERLSGRRLVLAVIAPGDRKRETVKRATIKYRAGKGKRNLRKSATNDANQRK